MSAVVAESEGACVGGSVEYVPSDDEESSALLELVTLFPSLEPEILATVLQAHHDRLESAVAFLMGMGEEEEGGPVAEEGPFNDDIGGQPEVLPSFLYEREEESEEEEQLPMYDDVCPPIEPGPPPYSPTPPDYSHPQPADISELGDILALRQEETETSVRQSPSTPAALHQEETETSVRQSPSTPAALRQEETETSVRQSPLTPAARHQEETETSVRQSPWTPAALRQEETETSVRQSPLTPAALRQEETETSVQQSPWTPAALRQEETETSVRQSPWTPAALCQEETETSVRQSPSTPAARHQEETETAALEDSFSDFVAERTRNAVRSHFSPSSKQLSHSHSSVATAYVPEVGQQARSKSSPRSSHRRRLHRLARKLSLRQGPRVDYKAEQEDWGRTTPPLPYARLIDDDELAEEN